MKSSHSGMEMYPLFPENAYQQRNSCLINPKAFGHRHYKGAAP
jgi:hypothetical protein